MLFHLQTGMIPEAHAVLSLAADRWQYDDQVIASSASSNRALRFIFLTGFLYLAVEIMSCICDRVKGTDFQV